MRDENYFVVQGWMVNRYRLHGAPLIVYAIIYGFSQTAAQVCTCSHSYFADAAGVSLSTIQRALKKLEEEGRITVRHEQKRCAYKAVVPPNLNTTLIVENLQEEQSQC